MGCEIVHLERHEVLELSSFLALELKEVLVVLFELIDEACEVEFLEECFCLELEVHILHGFVHELHLFHEPHLHLEQIVLQVFHCNSQLVPKLVD